MQKNISRCIFGAIGMIVAGAFSVSAEQVQNWFAGGASGTTAQATNGAWNTPVEDVTIADGRFTIDTAVDTTLDFTPSADKAPDTNIVTRVTLVAKFFQFEDWMVDAPEDAKSMLTVSNSTYCAYCATGESTGVWKALSGAMPDLENDVTVLIELDYKQTSVGRVRYAILTTADEATTTNYLYASGASAGSWLDFSYREDTVSENHLLSKISFGGEGELASVLGDVQMGLFANNGVKYGTSAEAVAAAQAAGGVAQITVLRDNDEKIEIPSGSAVAIDMNGRKVGEIDNKGDQKTEVALPTAKVESGNGEYVLDASVTDASKVKITSTDESKEVAVSTNAQGKLVATVKTSDAVISGKLSVAGKTLSVNDKLREYLTQHGGTGEGSYNGKNSSGSTINATLNSTPSGATRTMGQSYALGLEPTEEIKLEPKAADTETGYVNLAMPNVTANSDFAVTYQVQKHNGTEWVDDGDPVSTPKIPVGSGRYRVNTVIAPSGN